VRLSEFHPGAQASLREALLSHITYENWARQARTLSGLGAYAASTVTATTDEGPLRILAGYVTPGLFELLGARPLAGRFLSVEEGRSGADGVAVVSEAFWRRRLGGSADVVGRPLRLNGRTHVIVGVAPTAFAFPSPETELWIPLLMPTAETDPARSTLKVFLALGRLAPGASVEQAQAEGTAVARGAVRPLAAEALFGHGGPVEVRVEGLHARLIAGVRPAPLVLAAAVGLVLCVACLNVANLLLTAGVTRRRELAVRAAVGAGQARLGRLVLTESLVLALAGGVVGVGVGWALTRAVPLLAPHDFPRLDGVALNARALGAAALLSLAVGVLAGLLPAARAARGDLVATLRDGDGHGTASRAGRLRAGLLVVEAALAVVLLVGAGLLAHSFARLYAVDGGFDSRHVLVARVLVEPGGPGGDTRLQAFTDALRERLLAVPGVEAVGAANMTPLASATAIVSFTLAEHAADGRPRMARARAYTITPGYAEALGLRLRQGRLFTREDAARGTRPVLVNDAFVQTYLADGRPVAGRPWSSVAEEGGRASEIVGVVGNVLKDGPGSDPQPEIYRLAGTERPLKGEVHLVVRCDDPRRLAGSLRGLARALEPSAAIDGLEPLSERLAHAVAPQRFATAVLLALALLATLIAAVGLYGALSYDVARRRRELAIRSSLGAAPQQLLRLVMGRGLRLTLAGLVVGLLAAAGLTRLVDSLLFGITPHDALAFASAAVVLGLAAAAASLLPACRAARADPTAALQAD
jgi:predicted permease